MRNKVIDLENLYKEIVEKFENNLIISKLLNNDKFHINYNGYEIEVINVILSRDYKTKFSYAKRIIY